MKEALPDAMSSRLPPPRPQARGSATHGDGSGAPAQAVTQEDLGDTATGRELAKLIAEVRRQHAEFAEASAGGGERSVAKSAERAASSLMSPGEAPDGDGVLGTSAGEIVAELLGDVEKNLSGYLAQFIEAQRVTLESRLEQRLAALEQEALAQLEARTRELEARHARALAEKEQRLAASYAKLSALAERIGRQKADIQKARKQLETMLQAASRVHREVYRVGNALVRQVDHLDDFADEVERQ